MQFRDHIKTPQEWRRCYKRISNWRSAARRYAAENGDSIAYLADDSVVYFHRDHLGKVLQETVKGDLSALIRREEIFQNRQHPH